MSGVQNLTVTADEADIRLDRWFKRRFPHVPFGMVAKLIRKGQVRVDGGRVKPEDRLQPGQSVRVPPMPEPGDVKQTASLSREDAAFARSLVIYQDKEIIAFNKPPGLAVQGGSKVVHHIDRLLDAFGRGEERPRLVHRLDKDTSGVLIVAKTAQTAKRLSKLFQGRELKKTYWAVVLGVPVPKAGEIKGFVKKATGPESEREQMVPAQHGEEGAQYALTRYAVADEAGKRVSWVALRPETGRTHQLRVHLAGVGHSILGDGKYVCDIPTPEGLSRKLHLHARKLEIPRPSGKPLVIEADMPRHMTDTFDALGFDPKADLIFVEEALT